MISVQQRYTGQTDGQAS